MSVFNRDWFIRIFVPLVKKARKSGIDPKAKDRFITWIADHKNDNVNYLPGTIQSFMAETGTEVYELFVDDAISW